jgi:TatD DNase family protein
MSYLIDTHCHLDVKHTQEQLPELIERAKDAGVAKMIWIGIDAEGTERAVEAASQHDCIYAAAGVHPHDSVKYGQAVGERFRELASNSKVVAIGETGLDFFRDYSPRDAQFNAFREQCEIACEMDLPLIIHSRDAADETWQVVEEFLPRGLHGTFHCYGYDLEYAKKVLDSGFYISVNAIMTYPKSNAYREMVKQLPIDRLLLETDAPFLLPQKYRHRDNEPAYLVEAFKKSVEILDADPAVLMETLRVNSERCFPRLAGGGNC